MKKQFINKTTGAAARLLRRSREHIRAPCDFEALEPGRFDRRLKLCLQQSAGDSALPEVDIALG